MRIRGSGSGFGSFSGKDDRSESFRQKHRLGQKVKGTLLKNIAESMAWVAIDGDKLLAQLQRPRPEGARLTFIIKQLVPDIILKEIFESSAASTSALNLAKSFDTARTLFENALKKTDTTLPTLGPLCQTDFLFILANSPKLYTLFRDATHCAQTISNELEYAQKGSLLYQPWLAPDARRQVTHIANPRPGKGTLIETTMEFEHDSWGLVRVEFLCKGTTAGYKLKLQTLSHTKALTRYLSTRNHRDLALDLTCLGVTKLPRRQHGGILAELLFRPTP